jgi:hypothetical protein
VNNVTTTKYTSTDKIAFMADEKSVLFSFDTSTPNLPPVVFAGNDGTAVTGTAVNLNGSASDDGQPTPSLLSVLWSVVSGPGTVAFGNSALAATTATFSAAGNSVLQLAASDGLLSRTDTVAFTVSSPSTPPVDPPIGGGSGGSGSGTPQQIAFQNGLFPNVAYAGMTDTLIAAKNASKNYGNDTKMTIDGSPDEAGLFRWDISAIPVGSTVDSVTIEFNVTGSSRDSYEVYALQRAWNELSATWQRYSTGNNWASAGANGAADAQGAVLGQLAATTTGTYRINFNSAGVAAVQQWIDDPTKNFGIIIKDYAVSKAVEIRTSEASTASQRPKLVINFRPNTPPVVDLPATATAEVGQPLVLGATVTDDGRPTGVLLTALWTQQSGPGTAIFGDNTLVDTTATFDQPGTYVLRLTVSDSLLSGIDELSVSVT